MSIEQAKKSLDKVIDKARIHLYKPIQVAEILYRDRVVRDIDLADMSTYRIASKKWRDLICIRFLGRTSTSSARYQDDVFNENAIPPKILMELGKENRNKYGIVEAYIYRRFSQRFTQMSSGINYCVTHNRYNFDIDRFLDLFWSEPGLRRSIDKVYEIVVFSLFSALIEALDVSIEVRVNPTKFKILKEFEDFSTRIMELSADKTTLIRKAIIHRVGVTNASDRGLDMWANFGLAIQIKHLSLTEDLAESMISSISSDRIVVVCKDAEEKVIVSLLNQIGWKSKIQSVVVESDLINWYEKALRGRFAEVIGDKVLYLLAEEMKVEFPATDSTEFNEFYNQRGYNQISDDFWFGNMS